MDLGSVDPVAAPKASFNDALASMYAGQNRPVPLTPPESPVEAEAGEKAQPKRRLVKRPRMPKEGSLEVPSQRYADLGGIEGVLEDVKELVERPFRHPELYQHLGVEAPRGILLHGPPGCGKTNLAMAIAGELGVPLLKVAAPEVVAGMSGESEGRIRDLFEQARAAAPCLLFLDEVDAITPKRESAQREMERRMVAQLLACMDGLGPGDRVLVIGATNRPDALDPALRRAGRFDRELRLAIPDEAARLRMLEVVARGLRLAPGESLDMQWMARHTPGYVGADLKALCQEAAAAAVRRIYRETKIDDSGNDASLRAALEDASPIPPGLLEAQVAITRADMEEALHRVQPSAKREGFAIVPDITWEDIGALAYVREELRMAVVEPIRRPETFAAVGISAPAGVLLWGPPGCGKTLLAKAVAQEAHSNFISVKGPELLNKYVGESERAVRQVFERARASAPCVIFFDELDALCPRRRAEEQDASARVVNQLLTEMDGLEGRRQIFILAATNRPDIIDPAMTRPGRLDKLLYVRLPTAEDRADILRAVSRRTPWAADVDLRAVAMDPRCEQFSGADLAAFVREASMAAIREAILSGADSMQIDGVEPTAVASIQVTREHIETAFRKTFRSVSPADVETYERLYASLRS